MIRKGEFAPLGLLWVVVAGWALFAWSYIWLKYAHTGVFWPASTGMFLFLSSPFLLGLTVFYLLKHRISLWQRIQPWFIEHTFSLEEMPSARVPLAIALAAGTALFAELMMIRIHSSDFQLFAYFKNVTLLSCFLGLGIGYAIGSRRPVMTPIVLPCLALQIILMHFLRFHESASLLDTPVVEQISMGLRRAVALSHRIMIYGFIVAVFTANALSFIALGQLCSFLMDRKDKLHAYSWNLVGSILGIGAFSLLCFAWLPPVAWVLLLSLALIYFVYRNTAALMMTTLASVLLLALLGLRTGNRIDIYSPYQILTLGFNRSSSVELKVNNVYFQRILNLSPENVLRNPELLPAANHYELPYEFKPAPDHVLIVGAGTGNDVAAAIRRKARSVDAIEIDPAILSLGRSLHPERPYQSPAVNEVIADARAYLRTTNAQYDVINYGLLDSHTLLSGRSGVRLDSFVYTVEAFRQARSRLKPDGLLCLSFSVVGPELGRKIFLMLEEAFDGKRPVVLSTAHDGGVAFLVGGDMYQMPAHLPEKFEDLTNFFADEKLRGDKSTDDWPFFYMPLRKYPASYILMVVLLVVVSFIMIRGFTASSSSGFSTSCFFLGAGFMLVETKGITEAALLYGSTWIVISVMIGFVLLMAFSANWIVIKFGSPPRPITYGLLCFSILLGLFFHASRLTFLPDWGAALLATTVLALPVFFSGLAFSLELKRAPSVASALYANLMGAMLGGFVEYNSMYFGLRSLYFVALALYLCAFVSAAIDQRIGAPSPATAT